MDAFLVSRASAAERVSDSDYAGRAWGNAPGSAFAF